MNLFDKVKSYIDYNNQYTVQKALRTLDIEFERALKTNNARYAKDIIVIVQKLYDEFSSTYRESSDYGETMSYTQKTMAKKMRGFIGYLIKKLNVKTKSVMTREKEIKQILENEGEGNETNL